MKKIIIILFVISILFIYGNKDEIVIPSDAIRFRIIANSNSLEDQLIKKQIKDDIFDNVFSNIDFKENSDELISSYIPKIESVINKYNINYDINYGYNYFPKKTYNGINYEEGNYKSLVITLDNGLGDNYWCVLYPPLCLVKEETFTNNIEYKSLIKEIIDNYNK